MSAASSPFLYHVERFTMPRAAIREMLSFNRQYRLHVNSYRNVCPDSVEICQVEKECDVLWKAWDLLDDAKNEVFSEWRRRESLGHLLKIIGPDAFLKGEMPCHVPIHRFVEVR